MSKADSIFRADTKVAGFESTLPRLAEIDAESTSRSRIKNRVDAVELAKEDAEKRGYEEGFHNGHADGYAQGLKTGQEKGRADGFLEAAEQRRQALSAFTTELETVQQWFREAIDEWFEASEQKMTGLALDAVRAILESELSITRESAMPLVQRALREITHARHARIRVNPFDSALLQQHRTELLASSASLRDIEIVDDPGIVGGCVIETDGGVIDATVETQLECLEEAIKEAA